MRKKLCLMSHHRSFQHCRRTESIFRMSRHSVWKQTRRSWSNRANRHLVMLRVPHARTTRRNFEESGKKSFDYNDEWNMKREQLTRTSASKKTHFSNCVRFQQCNLVNVMPSSGRFRTARLAASFESSTSTLWTTSNTSFNLVSIGSVTPGVTRTAHWCWVETFRSEWATTIAPSE